MQAFTARPLPFPRNNYYNHQNIGVFSKDSKLGDFQIRKIPYAVNAPTLSYMMMRDDLKLDQQELPTGWYNGSLDAGCIRIDRCCYVWS